MEGAQYLPAMELEHEAQEPQVQDVSLLVQWGSLHPGQRGETHNEHMAGSVQLCLQLWKHLLESTHHPDPPSWQAGRDLSRLCSFRPAFQEHCEFESPCLGLLKARPPTRALFFWCISTISHFKLKTKFFKPLSRKSSLNHLFISISVAVIKENHISKIFSCTYQNPPSNQSISITITAFPCCRRY